MLGGSARDALRLEAAHAADGIEDAAPLEPGVDDDAHAVDREAGLGDVRREHDFAAARARRRERRILFLGLELAVERQEVYVGADAELFAQAPLDAADLAGARQEHQQVAGRVEQRAVHRTCDGQLERLGAARQRRQALADVVHFDGKHAAAAFDDGRAAEQRGDARAVDRRRHREHAQLGRDMPLRVERKRETDVGVQAAFVILVE